MMILKINMSAICIYCKYNNLDWHKIGNLIMMEIYYNGYLIGDNILWECFKWKTTHLFWCLDEKS